MLWRNSTAGVFDRQPGSIRFDLSRDGNFAAVRSEAQRVVEKITQSAIEQKRVGIDFPVTFVGNGNNALFRDRPIISGDLFDGGARGTDTSLVLAMQCLSARDE